MNESHKRHDFLKKKRVIEHKMCVCVCVIVSKIVSETFLSLQRNERDVIIKLLESSCALHVVNVIF